MFEAILNADVFCFHLINRQLTCGFFDWVMPVVTDFHFWRPFIFAGVLWLLFGCAGRYRSLALLMVVTVGISDVTSSRLIKPVFDRPRPCCANVQSRVLGDCLKSRSFPSSHAVNSAAVAAVVLFRQGPVIGLPLLLLSGVIAYSRVYVGVHYPLDVFGGMAIGCFLGFMMCFIAECVSKKAADRAKPPANSSP